MAPETLNKVKAFIRISHDKLNEDIQGSIESCLSDLKMHGVVYKDDKDPLILNAIKLYCKAIYTDDTGKAAEYQRRYKELRDCLKAAKGYGWEASTDE